MTNLNLEIGVLTVTETYCFYDQPVLFAAKNEDGQIYLVMLESDGQEYRAWLYAPLSESVFKGVRSGSVDIFSAFKQKAEGQRVYRVVLPKDGFLVEGGWVASADLSEDVLPEPGVMACLEGNE